MDISYSFLQHYWWFLFSLMVGIMVFMMFLQGGQTLLCSLSKSNEEKNSIIKILSTKWELTFTVFVLMGGVIFSAFPIFYSYLLSNTYWAWIIIILSFVLQAVSFEFKNKAGDLIGERAYNIFLAINGYISVLLLGMVVSSMFNSIAFDPASRSFITIFSIISNPYNWVFAIMLVFLVRILGSLFLLNSIKNKTFQEKVVKKVIFNFGGFIFLFVISIINILTKDGFIYDIISKQFIKLENTYLNNFIQMPIITVIFILGLCSFLWGIVITLKKSYNGFWFCALGTILVVLSLVLVLGFNNTAYLVNSVNPQLSLYLVNSSSSYYTLKTMFYVSFFIPFVLLYIAYVWRKLGRDYQNKE